MTALEEALQAATELLDAADERLVFLSDDWVAYDHAATEAVTFAAACISEAVQFPVPYCLALRHGIRLLRSLSRPTGMGEFRRRLWAELEPLGLPVEEALAIERLLAA